MNLSIKNYFKCSPSNWENWVWQEQNAIDTVIKLLKVFPYLNKSTVDKLIESENQFRFKITPYMLSLVELDNDSNPISNDPIWNQIVPIFHSDNDLNIAKCNENWEMPDEMKTPILQHKYLNRVNFRIQNKCLSYCMYCFEAKRVLDKKSTKASYNNEYFNQSINYIKNTSNIQEIVISGGEPLILSNEKLRYILSKFHQIKHIQNIRIQTRAFLHNPYRLDQGLIDLLNEFNVTAVAFHISHPNEISSEVIKILDNFSKKCHGIMLFAHIPLLKGINDDANVLLDLFMKLYQLKIKPYYLIHAMPETLGTSKYRTSVQKGVEILREIKRHYSNPAIPEYVIVHNTGKHTVPYELNGTSEFIYRDNSIEFKNWKGEWCIYQNVN